MTVQAAIRLRRPGGRFRLHALEQQVIMSDAPVLIMRSTEYLANAEALPLLHVDYFLEGLGILEAPQHGCIGNDIFDMIEQAGGTLQHLQLVAFRVDLE